MATILRDQRCIRFPLAGLTEKSPQVLCSLVPLLLVPCTVSLAPERRGYAITVSLGLARGCQIDQDRAVLYAMGQHKLIKIVHTCVKWVTVF